jgi:hypothetical protein
MMETPIEKTIKDFELLKENAVSLKDAIFLDAVIAVLQTNIAYEQKYIESIRNEQQNT